MRFIAIDYETGGLFPRYHAPVSVACWLFDHGREVCSFDADYPLLDDLAYTPKALSVNGYTWERLSAATKSETEIMAEMLAWAQRCDARHLPIVAHNAEFDEGFYRSSVQRTKIDPLLGGWICTKRLAREFCKGQSKFDLNTCLARYGLKREDKDLHYANEDAALCGQAYLRIMEEAREQMVNK